MGHPGPHISHQIDTRARSYGHARGPGHRHPPCTDPTRAHASWSGHGGGCCCSTGCCCCCTGCYCCCYCCCFCCCSCCCPSSPRPRGDLPRKEALRHIIGAVPAHRARRQTAAGSRQTVRESRMSEFGMGARSRKNGRARTARHAVDRVLAVCGGTRGRAPMSSARMSVAARPARPTSCPRSSFMGASRAGRVGLVDRLLRDLWAWQRGQVSVW